VLHRATKLLVSAHIADARLQIPVTVKISAPHERQVLSYQAVPADADVLTLPPLGNTAQFIDDARTSA
jgi:hypothetical protein